MSDPDQRIEKIKLPVEIERQSGVSTGYVFLMPQSRLSDLMNDSRDFLPFESQSGKFSAISKSTILSVTPLDETRKEKRYEGDNPYRILGVAEDAEFEEIKQAYLQLCASNHPDRIKGMGLSDQYVELATEHMSRINDAFQRINAQRGSNGAANGFNEADRRDADREAAQREAEAARKAAEEKAARLAAEDAAREAEVIETARKAAEEKAARLAAEAAAREEAERKTVEEDIGTRAEHAVLRAQEEIARKVEERAARLAQEQGAKRPHRAADSLRKAAHDLHREKQKKAG